MVSSDLKGSYSDALGWACKKVVTIPCEHWLAKGHNEDYEDAMKTLIEMSSNLSSRT